MKGLKNPCFGKKSAVWASTGSIGNHTIVPPIHLSGTTLHPRIINDINLISHDWKKSTVNVKAKQRNTIGFESCDSNISEMSKSEADVEIPGVHEMNRGRSCDF